MGVTTDVKKLASAIAGEVERHGRTYLEATSSPNHLKAVSALAYAQTYSQERQVSFHTIFTMETLEVDTNSFGKPRRLKRLKCDVLKCDRKPLPPGNMEPAHLPTILFANEVAGEQQLQDQILQGLSSSQSQSTPCLVVARGDTPVNRTTRVICRVLAMAVEQQMPNLRAYPCQITIKDALHVGFMLTQDDGPNTDLPAASKW